MTVDQPSLFWERLQAEHRRQLEEFGFDRCKRHQALRYFNWRWSWREMGRSEQLRFLLAHTSPVTLARAAVSGKDLDLPEWDETSWSKSDRWLYAFAVRLLWSYAERHGDPQVLALPEPELGGPLPVRWRGRLVSQDLANTSLETVAVRRALAGTAPRSIVEVGAGYGRTAYALLSIFPEATYTVVDIEPAIEISRWYLTRLFPAERLRFLSPAEAGDLEPSSVDLALSISSLQEMTPSQVAEYLERFDRIAAGGTVFLKQWELWRNPADGVEARFDEYPVPPRWRRRFRERSPVQTRFVQAGWYVPGPD